MRTRLSILFILFSIPTLAQEIKPTDTTIRPAVDTLPMSDIDIPIRVNLKALYRILEKKVDMVYHSPGWPVGYYQQDCSTRYMYRFRRGHLRLTALGNSMDMRFTGYYQIRASTRLCNGTTAYSPWTPDCTCGSGNEGARRVDVGFTTRFSLRPNYTLQAKVTRLPAVPIDQCTVCFWGQNITTQVMSAINAQMDTAGWGIQDTLARLNLRPQFQQLWQKLWSTYRLYNVGYLRLQPERLRISDLMARNDTLYLSVGISGRPLISLRPLKDTVTAVPDLSDFTPRHGFNIYMDARLDYDSLSSILNTQLDRQSFTVDNHTITIEKCTLLSLDQGHLGISLQISGAQSGTFYLSGVPTLDTATGILDIADLDYHLQTNNVLIRTASWLFNKKILKELKNYTRFPIRDYLEQIRTKANAQLNQPIIAGIRTTGQLDRVSILRLSVGAQEMEIRCQASGELNVYVDNLTW
ncbi:DUF4403 family protein [Dinghuibacter silviterrae]|uniref:Uncharacterized protein DUF4403 n=1 Tax=Dinghuibacter silviterrae TaxID=1539049 RepID=A0A4R8DU86_9BACT|nr:DUF4403 family protein [Dinghuibacter silviterrae]TDX00977.1 uncharacterized protein DUF4403 [Dinghuibacter silviterrae]